MGQLLQTTMANAMTPAIHQVTKLLSVIAKLQRNQQQQAQPMRGSPGGITDMAARLGVDPTTVAPGLQPPSAPPPAPGGGAPGGPPTSAPMAPGTAAGMLAARGMLGGGR
jgi:hypothetical protein